MCLTSVVPRLDPQRRRALIVALILSAVSLLGWVATGVLRWQALNVGGTVVSYSDSPSQPIDLMALANIAGFVALIATTAAMGSVVVLVVRRTRARRVLHVRAASRTACLLA